MKAKVYFNIRTHRWSIIDPKTKLVVNKPNGSLIIEMTDVEFKVSESGRQRVLRDRVKNVHSFAVGTVTSSFPKLPGGEATAPGNGILQQPFGVVGVSYNPYKGPTFVRTDTGEPVTRAQRLMLNVIDGRPVVLAVL